ncbi:arrestin-related trafficking adapter 3/6, partial [Phenoliferia sp. Uapishka_3]
MAPAQTQVSIRLTEPFVFLTGGQEHERARARRRRAARQAAQGAEEAPAQPGSSRPGSRSHSRASSPARGLLGGMLGGGDHAFVPPGPSRSGRSRDRGDSPARGSRSRSRAPMEPVPELGLSTGNGTVEEAEEADEPPPAMLRGLLTLTLARPSRIRDITVKFRGMARTEWPEGIGPRRLDVMEESVLIASTYTFFSASTLSNERRAASIGPGIRDGGYEDNSRGRTTRRAASVMPTRESSAGLAYPSRDSAIHEEELHDSPAALRDDFRRSSVPLSRISSSNALELMGDASEPLEPSPAYEEAVASLPSSPIQYPVTDLVANGETSRSPSLPGRSRYDSSPAPSPLGPSRTSRLYEDSPGPPLSRQLTTTSRLSQDDVAASSPPSSPSVQLQRPNLFHQTSLDTLPTSSSSTAPSFVETSDTDVPSGWNSAPVPGSTRSSFDRGRTPARSSTTGSNSDATSAPFASIAPPNATPAASGVTPTYQSVGSQRGPTTSDRPDFRRVSSTLSNTGAPPASRPGRTPSAGGLPGARTSSAKPTSRFSLAGLGDAIRKSTSKVRDQSIGLDPLRGTGRRAESPDTRREASRGESRGRGHALKALRGSAADEDSDDEGPDDDDLSGVSKGLSKGWKEFRAGTYTYPISIPVAASLPPSITSEFGTVSYALKATVHRAGALTPNLTGTTDVTLVSSPGQDDTEENESIVVERFWETQMKYHIALSGKSFPVGGTIPIAIRLHPMAKIKLYRVSAVLEQKTTYFASNRKLVRHEAPKKFPLMRFENKDPKDALLPIFTDDAEVLKSHPLAAFFINPTSSDDSTPLCFDPLGPWNLESVIKLPDCSAKLNFSTIHEKSNINISHILKIVLRVERGDDDFMDSKGKRKLWDVIIENTSGVLVKDLQEKLVVLQAQHGFTTTHTAPPSLPILPPSARLSQLLTLHAPLRPPMEGPVTTYGESLGDSLCQARELCRAFRVSGRSCFEVELEVGKRARREKQERLSQTKGKGQADGLENSQIVRKGVGVRLETFHKGKFHEPYYVVFGTNDAPRPDGLPTQTTIVHHTLPPWVPLRELSEGYLGSTLRRAEALGEKGDGALENRTFAPDLDLFLSHLQLFLDAGLSRRAQLDELRTTFSSSKHAALDFRAFSNISSSKVIIEWDVNVSGGDESSLEDVVVVNVDFPDLQRDELGVRDVLVRFVVGENGAC